MIWSFERRLLEPLRECAREERRRVGSAGQERGNLLMADPT